MDSTLCFEDIEVGQVWTSPGRTLTETDVVNFASLTGDFDPLHVDHQFAADSHYRKPIAHGLLGLSWVAGLSSNFPRVRTLAFTSIHDWHFTLPMYFGDTVHVETQCTEKPTPGKRSGKIVWVRKLINQDGRVVQHGTLETIVAMRSGLPESSTVKRPQMANRSKSESASVEAADSRS